LHAGVGGLAGRLAHLLAALEGGQDRAGDGDGDAGLLEFALLGAVVGVGGLVDGDGLGGNVDVAGEGQYVAAGLRVTVAGPDADIAIGAADGAGVVADVPVGVGVLFGLDADGDTDAAAAEDAGGRFFFAIGLAGAVLAGEEIDIGGG